MGNETLNWCVELTWF